MPSYKLMYFDGRGRAELARLLFTLAGQEFEDERIPKEDWPKIKPTTPFGQVPVLEIDGKPYAQSVAVANYLAREFGFYGKNNREDLEIDQVVSLVGDFMQCAVSVVREPDQVKKAELGKNFQEVEVPKFMSFFEQLLTNSGSGYFVGDSLSLADLAVYELVNSLNQRSPGLTEKYKEVKALSDKIEDNERIKAYMAARKHTDF